MSDSTATVTASGIASLAGCIAFTPIDSGG